MYAMHKVKLARIIHLLFRVSYLMRTPNAHLILLSEPAVRTHARDDLLLRTIIIIRLDLFIMWLINVLLDIYLFICSVICHKSAVCYLPILSFSAFFFYTFSVAPVISAFGQKFDSSISLSHISSKQRNEKQQKKPFCVQKMSH